MRIIGAAVLATTLVATSAFAATTSVAPLASGKPAGAKEAALLGPQGAVILVGIGLLAAGVAITVSGSNNNGVTSPTTSSTRTAGLP